MTGCSSSQSSSPATASGVSTTADGQSSASPRITGAADVAVADSSLLPAAIAPLAADPQAVAGAAEAIASGGDKAVPALIGAVTAMGISIVDTPAHLGVVVPSIEPSQGLGIEAGEIRALAELERRSWRVDSADFAWTLVTAAHLPIDEHVLWTGMVDGLRASVESTDPRMRMWASIVVEVGRHSSPSVDVLGQAENVPLTAVQASLMLLRFAADASSLAATSAPPSSPSTAAMRLAVRRQTKLPCSMSSREATILDAAAAASGIGYGVILDKIATAMPAAERLGAALGYANAALTLAKFIATAAAFKADVKLVGPPPLVRTKNTFAGEDRQVSATFSFDVGKGQMLNCFRILLNAGGLDFNLPSDGPIAGNKVAWSLTRGEKWVRLCSVGTDKSACGGAGNAVSTVTDDSGTSVTGVQGKPQKRKLGDDAKPVERSASVRAEIAIKDANLFQDLVDAVSAAASGLGGGVVIFTTEMLYRMKIWGASTTFSVKDWVDGVTWAITLKGSQTVAWDVAGASGADPLCYAKYHDWGSNRIDFQTSAPVILKADPEEFAAGYAGEIPDMSEQVIGGDNGYEHSGKDCTGTASSPPCQLAMSVPAILVIQNETVSVWGKEWLDAFAHENCTAWAEDLVEIAVPVSTEQLLGAEQFTVHGEAASSLPMRRANHFMLADQVSTLSVTTSWDITFTPRSE
jgi:hypothetical protein